MLNNTWTAPWRQPKRFWASNVGLLLAVFALFGCQSEAEIKRQKYITEGIQLYRQYCANCHQNNGAGLAALYPPLAGSDYLTAANKARVICGIKYGMQGEMVVNGKRYNRPMPAQPQLSDLEIAEITTYLYNEWGKETTVTSVTAVTPVLAGCK